MHGLADDNVVERHTRDCRRGAPRGRPPHQVLPLTGVTHMANQEEVAENLLLLQLDFLSQDGLGRRGDPPRAEARGRRARGRGGASLGHSVGREGFEPP